MSKHSHISAIFDNAFQSRAGNPDVYMSMENTTATDPLKNRTPGCEDSETKVIK